VGQGAWALLDEEGERTRDLALIGQRLARRLASEVGGRRLLDRGVDREQRRVDPGRSGDHC
jgi:hypothetical protein